MTKHRIIRVGGWFAIPAALLATLAGAAPTRATADQTKPRTLYIEQGKIHRFAQDGARITWIGGRHYVVHLRTVTGRRTLAGRSSWVLGNAGPGAAVGAQSASILALAGTRAVWVKYAGVMTREAAIYTSTPGQKKPAIIDTPSVSDYGGTYLAGVVASGTTILYGDAIVRYDPSHETWSLTGGGVHRYVGKWYPPRIPGIPPAFRIATGGRLIAVVPAKVTDPARGEWGAAPNGPLDVYNLSGQRQARVFPQGTVREVALDWPDLAVIVTRSDGTTVIERYLTGKLLATTTMPGASDLSIARGKVVFRVGNTIYMWWVVGKKPAVLWRSIGKPTGLSIEGKRVAWAANGRIRALNLPQ
ncbi:MAG TPA: hypothetical protein VH420_09205 [Gaiellaceae bacterium]|jgi:hypothetical protein